ncbi:MAG: PH domain-containing protein [Mycobacteriales bacterium]
MDRTFRHGGAERAAAVIWMLASLALGTARWWLLPLLIPALLAVLGAFRRGTDIDSAGVTVRAVLAKRRTPWEDIAELRPDGVRRVHLVRTDGLALRLPAMNPKDLAKLPRQGAA